MFRRAPNEANYQAGYCMQRGAVHDMTNVLYMERQQQIQYQPYINYPQGTAYPCWQQLQPQPPQPQPTNPQYNYYDSYAYNVPNVWTLQSEPQQTPQIYPQDSFPAQPIAAQQGVAYEPSTEPELKRKVSFIDPPS